MHSYSLFPLPSSVCLPSSTSHILGTDQNIERANTRVLQWPVQAAFNSSQLILSLPFFKHDISSSLVPLAPLYYCLYEARPCPKDLPFFNKNNSENWIALIADRSGASLCILQEPNSTLDYRFLPYLNLVYPGLWASN